MALLAVGAGLRPVAYRFFISIEETYQEQPPCPSRRPTSLGTGGRAVFKITDHPEEAHRVRRLEGRDRLLSKKYPDHLQKQVSLAIPKESRASKETCAMATGTVKILKVFNRVLNALVPIADLLVRIAVAQVFLCSGWVKFCDWSTTLMLFTHEYSVPVLSPASAAWVGTAVELVVPVFLLLGLGGRLPALILFVFNIIAVISYPQLWTEAGSVGLYHHLYWGLLLLVLMCHGPSKISLDYVIRLYFPALRNLPE